MRHRGEGEEFEAGRRGGYSKGQRRAGASDIERRAAWLAWPLVHWTGAFAHPSWPREIVFRPAACLIAERLAKLPAGLYAVRLDYQTLNPVIAELVAIERPLIADTLSALGAARKYPKELPRRVGDVAAWRDNLEQRLRLISAALDAPKPQVRELATPQTVPGAAAAECAWASGSAAAPTQFYPLPKDAGTVLAGLIGRACAFADPPTAVAQALSWLSACQQAFRKKGAGLASTVSSLQYWLGETGWKPANVAALLETLGNQGSGLLAHAGSDWDRFLGSHTILGKLAGLNAEERSCLVTCRLFTEATQVATRGEAALHALFSLPRKWLSLSTQHDTRFLWPNILKLTSRGLVQRLLAWLDSVPEDKAGRALRLLDDLLFEVLDAANPRDAAARQALLERHIWICGELLNSSCVLRHVMYPLIEVLRAREERSTPARLRTLARAVLSDPDRYSWAAYSFCDQLAGDDDGAFLRFLELSVKSEGPGNPMKGWKFLDAYPDVRQFLSKCAADRHYTGRVWTLLARLDVALRLQARSEIQRWLSAWHAPSSTSGLSLVAAYRTLAGEEEALPKSITALLGYAETRRRELETLRELERRGALPAAAEPRLRRLESQSAVVNAGKIERACGQELVSAKLAALETGIRKMIALHWKELGLPPGHDDPDWENALTLCAEVRSNRRILRALLDAENHGDRGWISKHPANAAWIERVSAAGVDAAAWLAARQEVHCVDGATWTLYLETNPLHVLQMGNLFSTCLSTSGINSFATVANAVEVNKRVLYIRDQAGVIVGRRLVALGGSEPVLIGFRSYGASPWVKILTDQFCLRLARGVGAGFTSELEIVDAASETLPLFAKWYNDGPETFDWWVADSSISGLVLAGDRRGLAHALAASSDAHTKLPGFTRALIWLGEEAIPLLDRLSPDDLRFVTRWNPVQLGYQ